MAERVSGEKGVASIRREKERCCRYVCHRTVLLCVCVWVKERYKGGSMHAYACRSIHEKRKNNNTCMKACRCVQLEYTFSFSSLLFSLLPTDSRQTLGCRSARRRE